MHYIYKPIKNYNSYITKRFKMFKKISQTLESSTIHAIPNIIRSDNLLIKFVWLICFICSSCICAWFILNTINTYFKYEVVSKIEIKYETPLDFPVVSICNLNPLATNEAKSFAKKTYKDDYPDFMNLEEFMIKLKLNNTNRHLFGKNLTDVIISCEFLANKCNFDEDFELYFDVSYGNCFRFNSGRNMKGEKVNQKQVTNTGLWNSLDLEIYIGSSIENENLFSKKNGFNIFITNSSTSSIYGEGINIMSGTSTSIVLNKYSIIKQPFPYSECTENLKSLDSYDSECYRKLIASTGTYFYDDCVRMCFQKLISEYCGCQSAIYDYVYNESLRKCVIEKSKEKNDTYCLFDKWNYMAKNSNVLKECNCPFECEFNGYQYSTSLAEFPTKYYFNYLINKTSSIKKKHPNISFEEMSKSIAKIQIFYDDLKYTTISQEVKVGTEDLISNIGGILGLFLGKLFTAFNCNLN